MNTLCALHAIVCHADDSEEEIDEASDALCGSVSIF